MVMGQQLDWMALEVSSNLRDDVILGFICSWHAKKGVDCLRQAVGKMSLKSEVLLAFNLFLSYLILYRVSCFLKKETQEVILLHNPVPAVLS